MRELLKKIAGEGVKEKYRKLRSVLIKVLMRLFGLLPVSRDTVVFTNVWGYADNPKYVAEALATAASKSGRRLKIYFISNKSGFKGVPKTITPVKNNSVAAIYRLSTARVWVDCNHKEPYIRKRRGQIYIQCWHGPIALKKLDFDCKEAFSEEYLSNVQRDSEMTDLFLTNGEFSEKMYRNAFKYKGEFARTGSPRMDALLEPSKKRIAKTKKRLGISPDTPLAVYAPTYREADRSSACSEGKVADESRSDSLLNFAELKKAVDKGFAGDYALAVRLHPLVLENSGLVFEKLPGRIINGNRIPDMYALLEAADVLITDYSNTLFEFGYVNKPVYLFAPDICAYEWDRGFYMDYEKIPASKAYSEDELLKKLEGRDDRKYGGEMKEYLEKLGAHEKIGASDRAATKILSYFS